MKTLKTHSFILAVAVALCLQGCGTHKVERVRPDETIDLSGRWNDSDSRMTADAMVDQILSANWISEHLRHNKGERPVVIVGLVYNKSHEHISADTYIKDVERAFINSGKVRLVQAGDKREELRRERAGQQEFASMETAKKWGRELGADYMLNGDINSIVDSYGKEKVNYYQVNLELSNLETNEVVWIGDKKIKKYIKN
ncbi:MAG: penicillin-binding protein activator LpoB [Cytophagaceae bacterium]|jgi:uncharacterized protein (TIGR02722 family)|nr:penicillin-binding protein activator LpoB [Cytophagaceae bacterium]